MGTVTREGKYTKVAGESSGSCRGVASEQGQVKYNLINKQDMARTRSNGLLQGVSGKLGQLVIKQYAYGTVITTIPTVRPSVKKRTGPLQNLHREHFAAAVAYARGIIRDPELKAAWSKKLKKGETVYNAAVKSFMSRGVAVWDKERRDAGYSNEHDKIHVPGVRDKGADCCIAAETDR